MEQIYDSRHSGQEVDNAVDAVQTTIPNQLTQIGLKLGDLESEVIYDVSANNDGATFASLSALLSDENLSTLIPIAVRSGGMSIRFVQTSDNKYVQYRLIADTFSTTESDWQGVDDEPTSGSENLVKSGGVESFVCEKVEYQESARYLFAITDSNNNVVAGITKEGKLFCDDDFLSYALANYEAALVGGLALKVDISSITDNLTTEVATVPLSANMGVTLKGLVDALNTALGNTNESLAMTQSMYRFASSNDYLIAILDSDEKVLWGIKKDGMLDEATRFKDSRNYIFVITDNNDNVIFGIKKDGTIDALGLPVEGKTCSETKKEIAIGNLAALGNYKSEKLASPIVDCVNDYNVGYKTVDNSCKKEEINDKFIVFGHDDGYLGDLIATRRIYNKYGFRMGLCAVFAPFSSISNAKELIVNYKKLIKEGHEVNLHAIIGCSYWHADRMFDVKPDGGSNFAPVVSEIKGSNVDGTGTNTFGKTITASTLVSEIYNMSGLVAQEGLSEKVVDITQQELDAINRQYNFYGDEYIVSGINDLAIKDILNATEANTLRKTRLQWLEYYYNGLVDNTLGYSSTAATLPDRFAEDYSVPSGANVGDYYPDAAHILNGKMVYWNDTTNAHYAEAVVKTASGFSESDYQLVGKFTKGFYKDCFSTCNYEVMYRCVEAAQAFFRHYYNLDRFREYHLHGIAWVYLKYKDTNGVVCSNREKTVIESGFGKTYFSMFKTFCSPVEIFNMFGIDYLKDSQYRTTITHVGQVGNYIGQEEIKGITHFGGLGISGFYNDYLCLFGTQSDNSMTEMTAATFNKFVSGLDTQWLKYFYEHAGEYVTRNGVTMYIFRHIYNAVNAVMSCIGSGKVPIINVDTIANSPAVYMAIDLLLRFFKQTGFDVVPYGICREKILGINRESSGNLFPNPAFNQTLLNYFGGSSDVASAYWPDGWRNNSGSEYSIAVTKESDDRVMTINGETLAVADVWGLKAGAYRLTFDIKGDGASKVLVRKFKNGDGIYAGTYLLNANVSDSWESKSVNITINEFYRNTIDETDSVSVLCNGYEDNTSYISLRLDCKVNMSIKKIQLIKL